MNKKKQCFIVVLLLSALIFASVTVSYAEDGSLLQQNHNTMYNFIEDHEYIVTSLSNSLAGWALCGPWCSFGAAVAGGIDESLVYLKYTDQRYLTHGILGAAVGNMAHPGMAAAAAGTIFGFILPTGIFNEHSELMAPVVSGLASGAFHGVPGLILGSAAGDIDELLIDNNITDKHYLTFVSLGTMASNPFFSPVYANLIGAVVGLIAANWENAFCKNIAAPLQVIKELKNTYEKFIPQNELNNHIEKQGIALAGSQILTHLFELKIISYQDILTNEKARLPEFIGNEERWGNYRNNMIYFAIFLIPGAVGMTTAGIVDDYFNEKLAVRFYDELETQLYTGKNALRMTKHENYSFLTDSMRESVQTMIGSGNRIASQAFTSLVSGLYAAGVIAVYSPNIAVYSISYSQAKSFIASKIAEKSGEYDDKIAKLDSDLMTLRKEFNTNVMTIAERGGMQLAQEKISNVRNELVDEKHGKQLWDTIGRVWQMATSHGDYILNNYATSKEIFSGRIPFADSSKVVNAGGHISWLFSLPGDLASTTDRTRRAIDKIIILEGMIHAPVTSSDQIKRIFEDTNQLKFRNLTIGTAKETLLTIDELALDMEKIYAVTGRKGLGKSALMTKVHLLVDNGILHGIDNGIDGIGEISYPKIGGKEPKVIFLGSDLFPAKYSLREILVYPDKVPSDQEQNKQQLAQIIELLKEMSLEKFIARLDAVEDWKELSKGERKELPLISAIIKKPDILILDEIFSHSDPESIREIQQILKNILKKYLSKSLILIIDHQAEANNYEGFYDQELHVENKTVVVKDFVSCRVNNEDFQKN
jgi:ABC-type uncharacterized transport system fused permease/ATPase subunit